MTKGETGLPAMTEARLSRAPEATCFAMRHRSRGRDDKAVWVRNRSQTWLNAIATVNGLVAVSR